MINIDWCWFMFLFFLVSFWAAGFLKGFIRCFPSLSIPRYLDSQEFAERTPGLKISARSKSWDWSLRNSCQSICTRPSQATANPRTLAMLFWSNKPLKACTLPPAKAREEEVGRSPKSSHSDVFSNMIGIWKIRFLEYVGRVTQDNYCIFSIGSYLKTKQGLLLGTLLDIIYQSSCHIVYREDDCQSFRSQAHKLRSVSKTDGVGNAGNHFFHRKVRL